MIPRTISTVEDLDWKSELSRAVTSLSELADYVDIPRDTLSDRANQSFALNVPRPYLDRVERGNPQDPLLQQVLPVASELQVHEGYLLDPLKEKKYTVAPGLIHKYKSRVLLVAGTHCAVNCRYCFRRHFPYQEHRVSREDWVRVIDYIRAHTELNEVILSGGDPLAVNDRHLQWLSQELEKIPHILRMRIHTRLPVVIPARIDNTFINWISHVKLQRVVVLHINHPNEIDPAVTNAIRMLRDAGVTVLNQSVLLAGINDHPETLATLSEKLFASGALPYYLHQLDPVSGAAHFAVDIERARLIYQALLAMLPGFLVPKWVAEIPDRDAKTPLDLLLC